MLANKLVHKEQRYHSINKGSFEETYSREIVILKGGIDRER